MNSTPSGVVREPRLQAFLASLAGALAGHAINENAAAVLNKIFDALRLPRPGSQPAAERLPVCAYLAEATGTARAYSATIASAVDDFMGLEPLLRWAPRTSGGPLASENWPSGHANAMIVGRGGLELRDDVQIGVSLLAPNVRYPDHRHDPEEVYLVLSRGRFKHGASSWFEPGIGGTFHNEPNIDHAMASDDSPLLAFWFLWSGT